MQSLLGGWGGGGEMFVQENKKLEFARTSGRYRHWKKADSGKRKG